MADSSKLNEQQLVFCERYLSNGFVLLEAYFYSHPKAKAQPGSQLTRYFRRPEVQEYIAERRKEIFESMQIDGMRVLTELSNIAFAEKGDKDYSAKDKLKALELLGKNLSLFEKQEEKKEQVIKVSIDGIKD